jgi:hypothetical protein
MARLAFVVVAALLGGACKSDATLPLEAGAGGAGGGDGSVPSRGGSGGAISGGGTGGGGGQIADGGGSGGCGVCPEGRACCEGKCVNLNNDPFNCGQCGVRCSDPTPFCGGSCQPPPCERATACTGGSCCGVECCGAGQICCAIAGPIDGVRSCVTLTAEQRTCPQGCAPLCISDRAQKKNITPVDPEAVLRAVRALPISTWSYKSEPDTIRHMGPMAQDFRAAFGLGEGDRTYHPVDAHGVTLAAIQALQARVEALERENRRLARKVRALSR